MFLIIDYSDICIILKIIHYGKFERAVLSRVPKGTEELNRNALSEGYRLALLSK